MSMNITAYFVDSKGRDICELDLWQVDTNESFEILESRMHMLKYFKIAFNLNPVIAKDHFESIKRVYKRYKDDYKLKWVIL